MTEIAVESAVALPAEGANRASKPAREQWADQTSPSGVGPDAEERQERKSSGVRLLVSQALLVIMAYAISRTGWYKSGDDFGYYIGLTGGILMILLFTYPLRKYVRAFHNWGPARFWFAAHMTLGILGPLLILIHSTFHLGSVNAAVAFFCMILVTGSGVLGRFIYVELHHGMYGAKRSLSELQSQIGMDSDEVKSKLRFAPLVETHLKAFESYAMPEFRSFRRDAWRFMTLSIRRQQVMAECHGLLKDALRERLEAGRIDKSKYARRMHASRRLVYTYLRDVQRVSQFSVYVRLFSLWHIAHVPFVYMLVLSAIAHVIAVHMY